MSEKTTTEEFKISSQSLVGKVKEIINEGNVRKISIKGKDSND